MNHSPRGPDGHHGDQHPARHPPAATPAV